MTKPNFLFICTDQQRSDSLGCYGNTIVRTPNIDRLAANGLRFDRHITPMQICSPSRATMITGLYPRHHKLAVNGMALPEDVPTLTQILGDNGYRTHSVGKQHLQPLLAPEEKKMPDSRAFWRTSDSHNWNGPYYGYQTLDLLLGESDTAHLAGHYANWLKQFPGADLLGAPESADQPPPEDLDEIWISKLPKELHYNTWITNCAVKFIEEDRGNPDPSFLFVSYPDPHHPFDPVEAYANKYDPDKIPLPHIAGDELSRMPSYYDELYPQGQGFRELYWAAHDDMEAGSMITTRDVTDQSMQTAIAYTHSMVEMIDDGVGEILEALEKSGKLENTIILFTSDHGELLGDHGLLHKGPPPYRQLTEVSMIMSGPGIESGKSTNTLTNHIDLAPTIISIAGLDSNEHQFDGEDLTPLFTNPSIVLRDYNFGEYHPTARPELYNQTVSSENWRLTLYPKKQDWGELFDLKNDPKECFNLFYDLQYSSVISELSSILKERFPPQPEVDNEALCKW